jgi:hypothetical protein
MIRIPVGAFMAAIFAMAAVAVLIFAMIQAARGVRAPSRAETECQRSCELLNVEYVDVTDYGCFCSEDSAVFIIGPESWGADD